MSKSSLHASSRHVFFTLLLLAAGHGIFPGNPALSAEDKAVIEGRVIDVGGRPVEGAMVFVYAGPEVRRPADFISAPTGKDGQFRLSVLPGRYWVVARLKKTGGFGPLMPGDRHSGEPKEIEVPPGNSVDVQIMVADLREAVMMHARDREGPARLSGRIVDAQGAPVTGVYAVASRDEKIAGIPDHVSAWVDRDGRYTILLPPGTYYIGSASAFPPADDLVMYRKMLVGRGDTNMDILRSAGNTEKGR